MNMTTWLKSGLFIAALTLVGCNLFNPSGEGDAGDIDLNRQGEIYFRDGQYQKAMDVYERAIAQDSSNSMAYYGYAKAAVARYNLNKIMILDDVEATAKDPEQFAFLEHPDSILTQRLQAASRVRTVLGLLTDRDTLSRWFKYLTDSSAADTASDNYDSLFSARRAFMQSYVQSAEIGTPGFRHPSQFPLTDLRKPYTSIIVDYMAFDVLYTFTRLYDLNGDNIVDERDALMKQLNFASDSGFQISNLSSIADSLEGDSAQTADMNNLVQAMADGLLGTSQLAGLLGGGDDDDTSSTGAKTSGNVDSVIAGMGDAVLFYQFGDRLDNDGDGCIDEEIMDEKDNDGDGYADEDARTIPFTKSDGVDNNLDGVFDPTAPLMTHPLSPFPAGNDVQGYEAPVGDSVYPGMGHILKFVYAYLDTTLKNGTPEKNLPIVQTTWVKIKKNADAASLQVRLDIQKDSLLTKRLPNGKLPASLGNKLNNAVEQVGGCWRNLQVETP